MLLLLSLSLVASVCNIVESALIVCELLLIVGDVEAVGVTELVVVEAAVIVVIVVIVGVTDVVVVVVVVAFVGTSYDDAL